MYEYRAEVDRVIDGDTCVLLIDLGLRTYCKAFIRLAHVDAPEKKQRLGAKAKARFAELLSDGPLLIKTYKDKQEKYGRWLGRIWNKNGIDVGLQLVEEGLARPYEGGRRGQR